MNTFNIKDYIAQVAENVLSAQPDYDFQLTEVSGLGGLEGIVSGQVAFDNFIATDSTGDGYVYQQPNGGYFMRRVATVFIMRKYQYMDMAAMREEVEKCRRYFNLIVAQMVADQPNLETKLIYLNTERIVIREFEPETSAHFTGLYFMLEFSQPYSLVAVPPVPPEPEPAYIKGHIVDGASTYSFKVNGNETINVNVNANGNWIWEVDRTITSLKEAFQAKTANLIYLELYLPNSHSLTDMSYFLYATNANNNQQYAYLDLVIRDIDTSNVTTLERAFRNSALKDVGFLKKLNTKKCKNFFNMLQNQYITEMDLRGLDVSSSEGNTESDGISTQAEYMYCLRDIHFGKFLSNPNNQGCRPIKLSVGMLVNVDADDIKINLYLTSTGVLTKQSVINVINATFANVTHTLQSSVYAKCASGGIWHADVQAALDAKAAEGFTVTLISA